MQMGTGLLLWAGWLWALTGAGMVSFNALRVVCNWRTGREVHNASMIVLGFYPLGVGCKMALLGPEFMRFYLSDIGFPVFLGYVMYLKAADVIESPDGTPIARLESQLEYLRMRRIALAIALGLSVAFEIAMGLAFHLRPDLRTLHLFGNFDWGDMAAYAVGSLIGFWLLAVWKRWFWGRFACLRNKRQPTQPRGRASGLSPKRGGGKTGERGALSGALVHFMSLLMTSLLY